MAAMPFLGNGTLLVQGNLHRVLPVIIYKYDSCLIPYIDSFLFKCWEWSSLVFKDFQKYFCNGMQHWREKEKKTHKHNIIIIFFMLLPQVEL